MKDNSWLSLAGARRFNSIRSFSRQTNSIRSIFREDTVSHSEDDYGTPPGWALFLNALYHKYGLGHALALLIYAVYLLVGASLFHLCENPNAIMRIETCKREEERTSRLLVTEMVDEISKTLLEDASNTSIIDSLLTRQIINFVETKLGNLSAAVVGACKESEWEFSTALLYANSLCTTVAHGAIYARTPCGQILTVVYAMLGIPLLVRLVDGTVRPLVIRAVKFPWYVAKHERRRLFSRCTGLTHERIRRLKLDDHEELRSRSFPLFGAISLLLAWIATCTMILCVWSEGEWTFPAAFYSFFMLFSAIGVPPSTEASFVVDLRQVLVLLPAILLALSILAILIRAVSVVDIETPMACKHDQSKCVARVAEPLNNESHRSKSDLPSEELERKDAKEGSAAATNVATTVPRPQISRERVQAFLRGRVKLNKSSQTLLSFPACHNSSSLARAIEQAQNKLIPKTASLDDVMKLVDTAEGDIILLNDLMKRDESSGLSEISQITLSDGSHSATTTSASASTSTTTTSTSMVKSSSRSSSDSQSQIIPTSTLDLHMSGLNATHFMMTHNALTFPTVLASVLVHRSTATDNRPVTAAPLELALNPATLTDLELIEELEDRMLLTSGGGGSFLNGVGPGVQFRSRLSLIPEHCLSCSDCSEPETSKGDRD